ncbi:MAG: Gldg family protein [Sedimentisphaerales bacterium]
MSRTIRVILAIIFVLLITFGAISICQNLGKRLKVDVTDKKLYTLSAGTKSILAKLNQPLKLKLYYAKTASMKGPDQIKYFNNYYEFVKSLLEEYVAASKGMVNLEIIDPRPYSDDEVEAARSGLKKFPITDEENFVFGLVVRTQFGAEKSIPFFTPDRQNFVEYDISSLIDTAITRQKKNIGVLSSLPIMGEVGDYMAQMMIMQGQQPKMAWTIIEHLKQKYEVKGIPYDTNDINDIDVLLVIHPKKLPVQTLFAIDQFILKGGRTIIFIDPYCYADQEPGQTMMQSDKVSKSSNLKQFLNNWGLDMPEMTFAGDKQLAPETSMASGQGLEKIIGFLNLTSPACFNRDNVITAQLNSVRVWFAGALNVIASPNDVAGEGYIERTPLIMTTAKGNTFKVDSPLDLQMLDPSELMKKFSEGTKPVIMGYLITGKFKSNFPNGIVRESEPQSNDANAPKTKTHITGLTQASENCAVVVFSDVDFISNSLAYYRNQLFGNIVVGDNSALLMNAIDDLSGSTDLISIRSRGNFQRPFTVVDQIEKKAEAATADEVAKLNAEITGFEDELKTLITSANEKEKQVIGSSIAQKTKDLELKKLKARQQLREVKMQKRQQIEKLGNNLRAFNMLAAPAVILLIAVALGIRRSVMKRHYISHASDA